MDYSAAVVGGSCVAIGAFVVVVGGGPRVTTSWLTSSFGASLVERQYQGQDLEQHSGSCAMAAVIDVGEVQQELVHSIHQQHCYYYCYYCRQSS